MKSLPITLAVVSALGLMTSPALAQDAAPDVTTAPEAAPAADAPAEADAPAAPAPEPSARASAQAEPSDASDAAHPASTNSFVLGLKAALGIPQLFSELGLTPVFGLEAGYILPFDVGPMARPLQVGLGVSYAQPGAAGAGEDPSITEGGASYDWDLTQRMLTVDVQALWRFSAPGSFLSPYAILGPRIYLMESVLEASSGGTDFGEHRETKTEVGLAVGGGLDVALGPGTLFGTLSLTYSGLDARIAGDSNTGALNLDVGYRLYLF
jgi:opacity protein-like surface antigen